MEIKEKLKDKRILSAIGIFIIISIISICLVKDQQVKNLMLYSYAYIILTIIMCIVGKFKIFSAIFLFFVTYTATLGISPICKYIMTKSYSENQYILILTGYTMFLIGYFVKIGSFKIINKLRSLDNNKKSKKECNDFILKSLAIILFVISIIACIIYATKNAEYLFGDDLENGRITALPGNGMLIQAINLGTISIFILFEMVLNNKFNVKVFALMFGIVMLSNGIIGFRSKIIIPVIILIIMYNKKKKITLKQIIPLIIILLIFGSAYGMMRGNSNTNILTYATKHFAIGSQNLGYILNRFPNGVEYQKGYTYIINILMLAPGPDPDFTLWLKEKLNMNFDGGGVTPTIIGEFYINFGFIGIVFGMLAIGMILKKLDYLYEKSNSIFMPSYLISIALSIVSGGIANIEINLFITVIVYYMVLYISKRVYISKE